MMRSGVVRNPDIDVVVELIGGYGVAPQLMLEAIANGKHVVTANKALLALHGNEIFRRARAKGVIDVPSRPRWPAASRSSRRCAKALSPTASNGSPASSTAPPTSSFRDAQRASPSLTC